MQPDRSPNALTLEAYETSAERWRELSRSEVGPVKEEFLQELIARVPTGTHVLEIGSGTGRDAAWLEEHGLRVRRTDGCVSFVELMREAGGEADVLNVLTDELRGPYGLIYASAVLLHLEVEEFSATLRKLAGAVPASGILAFTVKEGDGQEWSTSKIDRPRFFRYWTEPTLRAALADSPWTPTYLTVRQGVTDRWLLVICERGRAS